MNSDLIAAADAWRDSERLERDAKRLLDVEIRKAKDAGMSEFAIHKQTQIHRLTIARAVQD